jgi:hypothetical protein
MRSDSVCGGRLDVWGFLSSMPAELGRPDDPLTEAFEHSVSWQ